MCSIKQEQKELGLNTVVWN